MKSELISSFLLLVIFLIFNDVHCDHTEQAAALKFSIYPYKKNTGLENKYYGRFNRCSMKTDCQNYELEEHQNCI